MPSVENDGKFQVMLDVFSGRPNPSWSLDDRQAAQLIGLLKQLIATSRPSEHQDGGLGFRGFVIVMPSDSTVRRYYVLGDRIRTQGTYFRDDRKSVEAFLLSTMPPDIGTEFRSLLP